MIQQILPVNYYLESLYSVDYEIKMLLAAVLTGLLSLTAEHFSLGFRGKLPRKKPS
jgi:hypothetical protein